MEMLGPNRENVPETSIGKKVGSKWTELHDRSDGRRWFNVFAGNGYDPAIGAGGGPLIYPMNTFFEMKDPGIYTLEIQMQMIRYTPSRDPNEDYRNLIRFSPIKIKIEKPPDAN
jgi:hypothetical protein